jgi:hypothetical protein
MWPSLSQAHTLDVNKKAAVRNAVIRVFITFHP